jgi:hypothetical protein
MGKYSSSLPWYFPGLAAWSKRGCPLAIGCQRFGVKTLPRYLFKKHLNRQTGGLKLRRGKPGRV